MYSLGPWEMCLETPVGNACKINNMNNEKEQAQPAIPTWLLHWIKYYDCPVILCNHGDALTRIFHLR